MKNERISEHKLNVTMTAVQAIDNMASEQTNKKEFPQKNNK